MAKREHSKNLPFVAKKALKGIKPDAIAITAGPGLDPCLWTGIEFAKDLAKERNIPLIPVNHIEAHILSCFIGQDPKLPALALVISGGHTQLILVEKIGKYKLIGETRDDAAGECFDKTARILGLPYPGGPAIAEKAEKAGKELGFSLPRPMINTKDYDFSFSGLKTAVLYDFKKRKDKGENYVRAMAKEIQQAIIDVAVKKTMRASLDYGVDTILVAGGVSANKELKKQFKENFKNVFFPLNGLSTDNAVMVAIAGYYNRKKAKKDIKADPNWKL